MFIKIQKKKVEVVFRWQIGPLQAEGGSYFTHGDGGAPGRGSVNGLTLPACTRSCWWGPCLLPARPSGPKSKLGMQAAIWPGHTPSTSRALHPTVAPSPPEVTMWAQVQARCYGMQVTQRQASHGGSTVTMQRMVVCSSPSLLFPQGNRWADGLAFRP